MNETKTDDVKTGRRSGKLVYVVDDEPMLLELAEVILAPLGYVVKVFRDPEMALQAFETADPRPDLLVTDYAMHQMNGLELIDHFRRIEPGLRILLVSGTVGVDVFQEAQAKPDRFLAKPYHAKEFTSVVRALLALK